MESAAPNRMTSRAPAPTPVEVNSRPASGRAVFPATGMECSGSGEFRNFVSEGRG